MERELVGAADRFLATPVPQPPVAAPPALDAVGPLAESPDAESATAGTATAIADNAGESFAPDPAPADAGALRAKTREMSPASAGRSAAEAEEVRTLRPQAAVEQEARAWLEVSTGGGTVRLPIAGDGSLPGGTYRLILVLAGERIRECAAAQGESRLEEVEVICRRVLGSDVGSLADGARAARFVMD